MKQASEDLAKGRTLRTNGFPGVRKLIKAARAQGLLRG
jgi:hypothetical protein